MMIQLPHDNLLEIITEAGKRVLVKLGHIMFSGTMNTKVRAYQLKIQDILSYVNENVSFDRSSLKNHINHSTETFYFKKLEFGDQ